MIPVSGLLLSMEGEKARHCCREENPRRFGTFRIILPSCKGLCVLLKVSEEPTVDVRDAQRAFWRWSGRFVEDQPENHEMLRIGMHGLRIQLVGTEELLLVQADGLEHGMLQEMQHLGVFGGALEDQRAHEPDALAFLFKMATCEGLLGFWPQIQLQKTHSRLEGASDLGDGQTSIVGLRIRRREAERAAQVEVLCLEAEF